MLQEQIDRETLSATVAEILSITVAHTSLTAITVFLLSMHLFPVVTTSQVVLDAEQFVSVTLDGNLTIAPVDVGDPDPFDFFINVSCLC